VEKIGEDNQKVGNIGQAINQELILGLGHDMNMIGLKHLIKKYVREGMMVQML